MQIHTYLTFNGNCREAMTFYKECLGGKLTFQTIGESPLSDEMPSEMKACILHSLLEKENLNIMGTDMVPAEGLNRGNSVSLMLDCASETEIREVYDKLSREGEPTFQIEETFWGALFGGLKDKFGNYWLLNFNRSKTTL